MATKQHLVEVETNVGTLVFIETKRKNNPDKLKQPYEYILPVEKVKKFQMELNDLLRPYKTICQHAGVSSKTISFGIKLNVFVLAYTPGLCGSSRDVGVRRSAWRQLCRDLQALVSSYLGKDAKIYADSYSMDEKFQARFQCVIAYSEMRERVTRRR